MSISIEAVAKACHEANRGYCEAIGDTSQTTWEQAPDWQRQSAINGVNYHLGHPDSTPADSHVSWLAEKVETGWVYGEVKDAEAKTHPCCVPYEDLPAAQKAKDYIFLNIVRALAPEVAPVAVPVPQRAEHVPGSNDGMGSSGG